MTPETVTAFALVGSATLNVVLAWGWSATRRAYVDMRAQAHRWRDCYRARDEQFDRLRANSHRRDLLTGRLLPLGE